MELATPQGLATLIRREKETLLAAWEERARQLPAARHLKRTVLRDHLPLLLDELAEELGHPDKSRERLETFCAEHGKSRHQNGFDLPQIVEEYKLLRSCIVQTAELARLYVAGEASRVVNELIDEGIKTSIQAYIERRDDAEKKRREEYLKFLVHDLRSPLSAIYYAILLVEREFEVAPVNERARNIHGVIRRNIEQMQALISKLLQEQENVKTGPNIQLARAPTELAGTADSAIRSLASLATVSETQIVNEIADDIVVNADADLLERVFQNLIANAIDSAARGTVTVSASVVDDGTVECRVTDNGKGIPEEVRDKIFDKFVTASKQRSGIGLGLPIAKRIIEAHGGKIDVDSERYRGTTVRFTLPKT